MENLGDMSLAQVTHLLFIVSTQLYLEIVYRRVQSGTRVRAYTRTFFFCFSLRLMLSTSEDCEGRSLWLLSFPNLSETVRPRNKDCLMFSRHIF